MSPSRTHKIGSALALWAGVGCATAIVDEEPDELGTNDGSAATAAMGGTSVAASGGGTAPRGGTTSTGGTSGTSPAGGSAGLPSAGGRSNATGGAGASAGGAGAVAICPSARMPEQPGAAQGNSGSFDTTEAVCYFVEGSFNTWNCSNIAGRSVTINGTPSMCGGSLPEKIDGGYYFEFGAATDGTNYTSFYWYTS